MWDTRLSVVGEHPKDDKETRLLRQQAAFEAGRIQFPSEAPWLADCEAELLAFPSGRYDDQVDALLLLLERFANSPREYEIVLPEMNGRSEHLFDRFGWRSQGSNW